jgi:hypothetical protein
MTINLTNNEMCKIHQNTSTVVRSASFASIFASFCYFVSVETFNVCGVSSNLWQCNSRLDLKNWLLNQKFTTTPTIPTYAWWVTISPQKGQGQAAQACHVNILGSESAAMEDCNLPLPDSFCVFLMSTFKDRFKSHDLPCNSIILHCYYNILQHSLYWSNSQK